MQRTAPGASGDAQEGQWLSASGDRGAAAGAIVGTWTGAGGVAAAAGGATEISDEPVAADGGVIGTTSLGPPAHFALRPAMSGFQRYRLPQAGHGNLESSSDDDIAHLRPV